MSGPYTHSWNPRHSVRRFRVLLDTSGGRPIHFQRSVPFGRWTGVYHLWLWPLCFQVIVGPTRHVIP